MASSADDPARTIAEQAGALFGEAGFGGPAGVWVAPGRVNVIGEHTDYNEGFMLPMAIDRYTAVAARPRTDGRLRLVSSVSAFAGRVVELSADTPPTEPDGGWAAYPAGVAWALRGAGVLHGFTGADLAVASAVPLGAGLSSSAALECASGLALAGLAGTDLPLPRLAELAQRAENDYVGVPCGPLDQLSSALGAAGCVLFIDARSGEVTPHPFDLAAAGLTLLVIDTKVSHDLATSAYADRRAACERAARQLGVRALRDLDGGQLVRAERELDATTFRRVRHVVTEDERVLRFAGLLTKAGLAPDRLGELGALLTASHVSLRDDYEVSCRELDVVAEAAVAAGAYGARMTGGGFGGSVIALTALDRVGAVTAAVLAALPGAEIFDAVPAQGAHRVR